MDIVTALFSQRYRCGPCSNGTVQWKIDLNMFTNELCRVLREQPANEHRNIGDQPFPSFACGHYPYMRQALLAKGLDDSGRKNELKDRLMQSLTPPKTPPLPPKKALAYAPSHVLDLY